MKLLFNHVGYEIDDEKIVLMETQGPLFEAGSSRLMLELRDKMDVTVFSTEMEDLGQVGGWKNRYYYRADCSAFTKPGSWQPCAIWGDSVLRGHWLDIKESIYDEGLVSDLVYGIKAMRNSGIFEKADNNVPVHKSDRRVKAGGGWYDASGDTSKYLTHLSYAQWMNPQQIPLTVWVLLYSEEFLRKNKSLASYMQTRMLDEGLFGADYLVRVQDEEGWFYQVLFDTWSKDPLKRKLCAFRTQQGIIEDEYKSHWREGGGMAVAALARAARAKTASTELWPAEYKAEDYGNSAVKGYEWLKTHGRQYSDDKKANIIDDYCQLMAAVELFALKGEEPYRQDAIAMAKSIMARMSEHDGTLYLRAGCDDSRSYFHSSDEGMPIFALLLFIELVLEKTGKDSMYAETVNAVEKLVLAEIERAGSVPNPFNHPVHYVRKDSKGKKSFFMPHENETGYWWQGENARIASIAAAMNLSARHLGKDHPHYKNIISFSSSAINWILGRNPFDTCMLHGRGRNNPEYLPGYWGTPGWICNGITSGFEDEAEIAFRPDGWKDDVLQNWRWGEQWLPHGTWFLAAIVTR